MKHYSVVLGYLGCDMSKVVGDWRRLKVFIARDENLRTLSYVDLWERMFDHFSDRRNPQHFYHVLLVVALVFCFAIDTSICERGFSCMNMLKSARRSDMGTPLLRVLMRICQLGAEWHKDPASIPVDDIIEVWRSQSKKGRYEGAEWAPFRAAQLKAVQAAQAAPAPAAI